MHFHSLHALLYLFVYYNFFSSLYVLVYTLMTCIYIVVLNALIRLDDAYNHFWISYWLTADLKLSFK